MSCQIKELIFIKDVHKGLRYKLFTISMKAGSTDWDNTNSTKALGEELDALLYLLRSHVVHENTFCHPLIARLVPGGARALDSEHREQEAMLDELEAHFKHMIAKGSGRRWDSPPTGIVPSGGGSASSSWVIAYPYKSSDIRRINNQPLRMESAAYEIALRQNKTFSSASLSDEPEAGGMIPAGRVTEIPIPAAA